MKKIPSLLGLAARAGLLLAAFTSAQAALTPIDLTNFGGRDITGPNAGVPNADGLELNQNLGPAVGQITLQLSNNFYGRTGFNFYDQTFSQESTVAVNSSNGSDPKVFASGVSIGESNEIWAISGRNYAFRDDDTSSSAPHIGSGSYLGFRIKTPSFVYFYGYIEATWDSTNRNFQLLSAAFEDTPNQAIIAGGASASVPEPGGAAMMGVGVLAVALGVFRHFRKSRQTAGLPVA